MPEHVHPAELRRSSVQMILSDVVLPAPFGPTNPCSDCGIT